MQQAASFLQLQIALENFRFTWKFFVKTSCAYFNKSFANLSLRRNRIDHSNLAELQ